MLKKIFKTVVDHKVLGGILLITGTCLGGGILSLPISNSATGFIVSSGYLVLVWFIMTVCSYLILEVNLLFKPGTNLLTMASSTLGIAGRVLTGIAYFALLYNLLSAYISGGSGIIITICNSVDMNIGDNIAALFFVMIFGYIVFSKMHRLDISNRIFILSKLVLFIAIVAFSFPAIEVANLSITNSLYSKGIIMILCASFGFGVIIPSLREYLNNDPYKLRVAVIVGSIIPLVTYLIWDYILIGTIGTEMLINLADETQPTNKMIGIFAVLAQHNFVVKIFHIFAALCLITSFLGIALSMSDFLSDSMKIKKEGRGKIILFGLTFLPPLIMVLWFKEGFIAALRYAGICCVLLHIFLPILMVWSRLEDFKFSEFFSNFFKLISLILLTIFSAIIYINF
ncbi:MAG: tryptophan/tyrosine permease [Legionellales bacterium]|nr:tryptophan/tyrosine permease [Legionellales bacterium]